MTDPIVENLHADGWIANMNCAADRIRSDPQSHINALVEAGVLEAGYTAWSDAAGTIHGKNAYVVVPPKPPHEHDWRIVGFVDSDHVEVTCAVFDGCHQSAIVQLKEPLKYEGEVPS